MISDLQRIPKWLKHEPFELTSRPTPPHFSIMIDGYFGLGNSIAEAAKEARKKRDNAK
jgi:hypothetical protein